MCRTLPLSGNHSSVKVFPGMPIFRKQIAIEEKQIRRVSVLPVIINRQAQPEPLSASDPKSAEVIQYLREITEEADLNAGFAIRGDEAVIA